MYFEIIHTNTNESNDKTIDILNPLIREESISTWNDTKSSIGVNSVSTSSESFLLVGSSIIFNLKLKNPNSASMVITMVL